MSPKPTSSYGEDDGGDDGRFVAAEVAEPDEQQEQHGHRETDERSNLAPLRLKPQEKVKKSLDRWRARVLLWARIPHPKQWSLPYSNW